jgi:uncharacterized alkaline shock family protein YloU
VRGNKSEKIPSIKNDYGMITLAEEVVTSIVGLAASECYGVVGMAPRRMTEDLGDILKRDSLGRGVEVEWKDGKLFIKVFITVGYGTRISEVANNVIRQVHYSVEHITGLSVGQVNVMVRGVRVMNGKRG